MKVTFGKEYKKYLTLEEYDYAKQIIHDFKDDESTPAEYAEYAVNAIGGAYDIGGCERVIECSAEIAGNSRVYDNYGAGSGKLDVWIHGIAKTWYAYVEFGAYLTDIWSLDGENSADIARAHMYSVIFQKVERD